MRSKVKTLALKINKILYPEEIFIIVFFILFAIYFAIHNWQIIFTDKMLSFTIINRIFFPLVVFFIISFFEHAITSVKNKGKNFGKKSWIIFLDAMRVWLLLYIALIIHMNIKIRVPFINPNLFDNFYQQFDLAFSWLLSPLFAGRDWVEQFIDLGPLYTWGYEILYLTTFTILYLKNKRAFREMFFATLLLILLGSITYCLFPAIGPFYFSPSHSPYTREIQEVMWQKYLLFKQSSGTIYSPAYLIQGIAAMPSLHIANTFAFMYFIYKYAKKFSIIYIPAFIYILIDAVYTKYHYLLDVIFGLLLAIVCIYLVKIIYQKREQYLSMHNSANV